MSPSAKQLASEIDDASRWWKTYPILEYTSRAQPYNTYQSYIHNDVYAPVNRLWKSASSERLSSWSKLQEDASNLQRVASVSTLSPSQRQPVSDRVATRYVPMVSSYQPKQSQWRDEYYFTRKHAPTYYVAPMYLPIGDRIDGKVDRTYSSKRFDMGSKITRPAYSHTRWQYAHEWESSKLRGLDVMAPYMYTNYDRERDSRHYMRVNFQCRRFEAPYDVRKFYGDNYAYNPISTLVVYDRATKLI